MFLLGGGQSGAPASGGQTSSAQDTFLVELWSEWWFGRNYRKAETLLWHSSPSTAVVAFQFTLKSVFMRIGCHSALFAPLAVNCQLLFFAVLRKLELAKLRLGQSRRLGQIKLGNLENLVRQFYVKWTERKSHKTASNKNFSQLTEFYNSTADRPVFRWKNVQTELKLGTGCIRKWDLGAISFLL